MAKFQIKPSTGGDPEKGARTDGKGFSELANVNNEDAARKISRDMEEKNSRSEVARKRKNTPKRKVVAKKTHNKPLPEFRKRQRRQTDQREAEDRVPSRANSNEIKAVMEFVKKLDPDIQTRLKAELKKKLAYASDKISNKPQAKTKNSNKMTTREMVEQKRGIQKRPTALQLAKEVAEKARKMIKNARNRILGQKQTTPASQQQESANSRQQQVRQQKNSADKRKKTIKQQNSVKILSNNKGRE